MEFEVVCVDHGIFPSHGAKTIRYGIRRGSEIDVLEKRDVMHRMASGDRFFVERGGHIAFLITGISPQGNTFLQTDGDETLLNNLLSLPGCTHNDMITFGTGVTDPDLPVSPVPAAVRNVPAGDQEILKTACTPWGMKRINGTARAIRMARRMPHFVPKTAYDEVENWRKIIHGRLIYILVNS